MMRRLGKKLLRILTAGVLTLSAVPVCEVAVCAATAGALTYQTQEDGTISITDCSEDASGELVIPAEIDGKAVTHITYGAFENCNNLTAITIPGSISRLPFSTLSGLEALTCATISDGVTCIGFGAFWYCWALETVTIPASVTSIESSAFDGCAALTDVYYTGTKAQWDSVSIANSNGTLVGVTVHFSDGTTFRNVSTGDLDGDGSITTNDAYNALLAYSQVTAGGESGLSDAQESVADVDGNGNLTTNDAYLILKYYSIHAAGQEITWEELLG